MCVAGWDPSGGAGVLADAAVARALGVHPLAVVTGVAAQNSTRFGARHDLPAAAVQAQLDALAQEFAPGAVKIGMPGSAETVDALAQWLEDRPRLPVVVDPVTASTSGGELASAAARQRVMDRLFSRATVLTPNLDEAKRLAFTGAPAAETVPALAGALRAKGPDWVLITAARCAGVRADDFLAGPDEEAWLEGERQPGGEVRGTGCALATALAAGLALGHGVPRAAREAKAAVAAARARAYSAGDGRFLRWS